MYNKTGPSSLWRMLLRPLAILYSALLNGRHYLYDRGIFHSETPEVPTLCIGNLGLGGTGKTPMVEYILGLLGPAARPAVLSRGYGRQSKGFLLASPGMKSRDIGDEPLQIFTNFPEVPLAVDADRLNGIRELQRLVEPRIVLLDDAMQHRKVRSHETLLLTEYSRLYTEDELVPAGRLRDVKIRAATARTVVVTKCPEDLAQSESELLRRRLRLNNHQQLVCCTLVYESLSSGAGGNRPLEAFRGSTGAVVTGIANPAPFITYLERKGVDFRHFRYPDHHRFTDAEVDSFASLPWQLTTQKDYMRLRDRNLENLFYVRVAHKALWNGEDILKEVLNRLMV